MNTARILPCPDCGKPISARFPMHTCKSINPPTGKKERK